MTIEIVDFPIKNGGSFHSYVSLPEGKWIRLPPGTSNLLTSAGNWCQPWQILLLCLWWVFWEKLRRSRSHPMNILHPKWLQKWWIPQLLPYLNHPKSFTVWFSWEKYGKMMINQYQPWDSGIARFSVQVTYVKAWPGHQVIAFARCAHQQIACLDLAGGIWKITKEHQRLAGLLERPIIFEQVIGND